MKGAVIYARYSCERQTEQSIEGQLHECYKYAEKNGLSILDEYIDRATTGTNDNRPAFQKMLADSERTTAWDIVLVYAIDRFGRNSIEIAINKQKLIKNGKNLISATQRTSTNIDGSKNLDGILLENMYIGLAEYYSAELSQKIRRGLAESRDKGLFCGGGITYGYNVVNKHIVINDEQAEIVRYIFQEYNNGKILPDIIDELNARGYRYKGGEFVKPTLYRLLRNEKYIGITKYMGVEYKNIYPPIISEDLFYSIQKRLATYKLGRKCKDVDLWLKAKVFCGYCGRPMHADASTSQSGKRFHYYKCSGRKDHICNIRVFRQDKLDKFVFETTLKVFATDENIELLIDKIIEVHKKKQKDESILIGLKSRLNDTKKSIDNLLVALQEGIITTSTKERLTKLENDKADLEKEIANEENKLSLELSRDEVEKYLRKSLSASPKILLNNLIEKIIAYDDKIEIYYKYSHYVPDDPDDQRGHFFSKCEIPINRGSRTKQVLDITIEKHTIHFFVRYGIKRNKDLCLPINYKTHDKNKTSAHVSATCADGSRVVETIRLELMTSTMST